jgi:hypothetical protein
MENGPVSIILQAWGGVHFQPVINPRLATPAQNQDRHDMTVPWRFQLRPLKACHDPKCP